MRCRVLMGVVALLVCATSARAYVEAPHSLGQCINESTNIVLVEVSRVDKDKGLIIYKKVQDLKGKHPQDEVKHNIGKRGFHEREWKNVMAWADTGKRALFFHNGGASETCIGTYWYQCYPEGQWWGMSHAEPFLLRTFYGDVEKLTTAVTDMLAGKEVIVTCLADGNKDQLHLRKGKLQRMKASLKRGNYDAKRDFVGFGGDGDEAVDEFKTITLLGESTAGWKYLPAKDAPGDKWRAADFDDGKWQAGKAPLGYGEEEITKRQGTTVAEKGVPFVFRRSFEVPSDLLSAKGVVFKVNVASDDCATVWLNGAVIDDEGDADHEFAYWNRELELNPKQLKSGKNVLAILVKNKPMSSDIYLDMEVSAQVPVPPKTKPKPATPNGTNPNTKPEPAKDDPLAMVEKPGVMTVDKAKRTVTINGLVAPRKLPNLNEIYPLEVVATYPAPLGQKAHETVVTFTALKPGSVQKALMELGLKPGKPARGEGMKAEGPELKIALEFTAADGKVKRVPIEQLMVDRKTGKPMPAVTWHFTGSPLKQPDPEKNDKVFGSDMTGTLISIFPVTDDCIIQSSLTMKEEAVLKLEVAKDALPKEGTAVRLIIEVK